MSELNIKPNEGKELIKTVDGTDYMRIPVKTHVITDQDTLKEVVERYIIPNTQQGDIVFISEKAVSCIQKRAVKLTDIKPRWLARTLSKYVYKNPYGIGLSMPETMEMALVECGTPRILFAGFISVIGKLFGQRGWFYMIAGDKARSIDGPCDYTLPPYNEYVVLGPNNPDKIASEASQIADVEVAVVDLNDLGGNILGLSNKNVSNGNLSLTKDKKELLLKILKDNPLGQGSEQTPIGIIRKV